MGVADFLLAAGKFVPRDITSLCISANWGNASVTDENVFVVLAAPALVMDVQQGFLVFRFDLQLNQRGTPNVLCVQHVNSISSLNFINFVFIQPSLVIIDSLFESLCLFFVPKRTFTVNQHLDRIVDDVRLLKDPLSDVFAAMRALLFPDHALGNALFAKRMSTYCCPAAYDVVHTNRTSQPIQLRK